MLAPRIYWLGSHQTLRYEEVPLLIEAGAEVIPDMGDHHWLKYDSNYNNESDMLYPHWRISCTLPINIVEKIRQIEFWENRGEVTAEEAELINRWIDVMFISHYPDVLKNVIKWYQGYIVYRVFGVGDFTTYTALINKSNIDLDRLAKNDKYVWTPILNSLEAREDPRIVKNKLYINAFVSKERLGFEWKGKASDPFISTAISYLDGNPVARKILKNFTETFEHIPFVVLGKNSKEGSKDITDKVLGHVDDNGFYSKIAESRVFVYIGLSSNYHLHYPPIEAMSMGVPVIFLKESGLAQEARDHGITNEKLKKIGMCNNIQDMKELIIKIMNDFEGLEKMAREQLNIFEKIFSRKSALVKVQEFFKKIQPYIQTHRKKEYDKPISYNIVKKDSFKRKSIETDIPTEAGESVIFSSEKINAFTGKLVYDHQGRFIARRVEQGMDSTGLFIASYIKKMQPGEYMFSIELNSSKEYNSSIGYLLIGVWNPEFNVLSSRNIDNLKSGKNTISIVVKISPEDFDVVKEIRLVWNGAQSCEIPSMTVKKVT